MANTIMGIQTTADLVTLLGAPTIPGLTFRFFGGEPDYPKIVAVFRGSKDFDEREQLPSIEEMTNNYAHQDNFDPYRDVIVAEMNGEVIGYSRVTWWREADGARIYSIAGLLLPAWRRRGIGRAMLRWAESRAREIAAEHSPVGPRFFEEFIFETEEGKIPLLLGEGYVPAAYYAEMLRSDLENIPAAALPPGLEIRPVQPEHYRAIWDADDEASRDHWGYTPATEQAYQAWLNDPVVFQPELWCVAWDVTLSQVAGQVRNFINHQENEDYGRKWGYPEFISVRRPWRRRGLARALLVQSLHILKEHGMEAANLGVHVENPNGAFRLYESVGFQVLKMYIVFRKPMA